MHICAQHQDSLMPSFVPVVERIAPVKEREIAMKADLLPTLKKCEWSDGGLLESQWDFLTSGINVFVVQLKLNVNTHI